MKSLHFFTLSAFTMCPRRVKYSSFVSRSSDFCGTMGRRLAWCARGNPSEAVTKCHVFDAVTVTIGPWPCAMLTDPAGLTANENSVPDTECSISQLSTQILLP